MYTVAFVIGFFTSWGWWSAGKIQKQIDSPPPTKVEQQVKESK